MLEKDNPASQGSSFLFTTTATTITTVKTAATISIYSSRAKKKLSRATLTCDSLHKSDHIINTVIFIVIIIIYYYYYYY